MGRLAEEVPSGPWLQAKKIEDQRTANKRVQATWEVPEALREVFVIETILSADECTRAVPGGKFRTSARMVGGQTSWVCNNGHSKRHDFPC